MTQDQHAVRAAGWLLAIGLLLAACVPIPAQRDGGHDNASQPAPVGPIQTGNNGIDCGAEPEPPGVVHPITMRSIWSGVGLYAMTGKPIHGRISVVLDAVDVYGCHGHVTSKANQPFPLDRIVDSGWSYEIKAPAGAQLVISITATYIADSASGGSQVECWIGPNQSGRPIEARYDDDFKQALRPGVPVTSSCQVSI